MEQEVTSTSNEINHIDFSSDYNRTYLIQTDVNTGNRTSGSVLRSNRLHRFGRAAHPWYKSLEDKIQFCRHNTLEDRRRWLTFCTQFQTLWATRDKEVKLITLTWWGQKWWNFTCTETVCRPDTCHSRLHGHKRNHESVCRWQHHSTRSYIPAWNEKGTNYCITAYYAYKINYILTLKYAHNK